MIIKLDHISYVARRSEKDKILRGKHFAFFEEKLENAQIKRKMMSMWHFDHDIYYFDDESFPIEYIFYDSVVRESGIILKDNTVSAYYRDAEETENFLERIFKRTVTRNGNTLLCNMRGILDRNDYWLSLSPGNVFGKPTIDQEGFGTVALIVDSNDEYMKMGYDVTKSASIVVDGRKMDISFIRSELTNMIFEIIKVNV